MIRFSCKMKNGEMEKNENSLPFSRFQEHVNSRKKKKPTYSPTFQELLNSPEPTLSDVNSSNDSGKIRTNYATLLRNHENARNKKRIESIPPPKTLSRFPQISKKFRSLQSPKFKEPAPVKMNLASVVKEEFIYLKRQKKEADILRRYEENLRDGREYAKWREVQERNKEKAIRERVNNVKIELENLRKKVRKKKRERVSENRNYAESWKKEYVSEMEKLKNNEQKKLKKQKFKNQKLVEQNERKKKRSQRKLERKKTKLAKKTRRDTKLNEMKVKINEEQELLKNKEVIQKIRAEFLVPYEKRDKLFDPTEEPHKHLVGGMSHLELKIRVENLKNEDLKEIERKRNTIQKNKLIKRQRIRKKVEKISHFRRMAKLQRQKLKLQQKRKQKITELRKAKKRDDYILQFHQDYLENERRKEKERKSILEAEEERKRKIRTLELDKETYERKKWDSVMSGRKRKVKQMQEREIFANSRKEEVLEGEKGIRNENRRREKERREDYNKTYDESLEDKKELKRKFLEKFYGNIEFL